MKRGIKWGLIILAVAVLAGLWTWRYVTMNAWYDSFSKSEGVEYHQMAERLAFGENRLSSGETADGYFIKVNSFEIVDYRDFLADWTPPEDFEPLFRPDKLALVRVTLYNEDSDAVGVLLTSLGLHGDDAYAGMDWDLLTALNPVLEGAYGICLPKGAEYDLVLPYGLFSDNFSGWTWRHIETYPWVLHLTAWPKELDVVLNG